MTVPLRPVGVLLPEAHHEPPFPNERRDRRDRLRRLQRRFLPSFHALEGRQLLSTVSFLGIDSTTQGNWKGTYGADGYDVAVQPNGPQSNLPSYASLSFGGQYQLTGGSTSETRGLLLPGPYPTERHQAEAGTRVPASRST